MSGSTIFQRDQGLLLYVSENDKSFTDGNEQQRMVLENYLGPALEVICNGIADQKQLLAFLQEIIELFRSTKYDAARHSELYFTAQKQFRLDNYTNYVAPFIKILLLPHLSHFEAFAPEVKQFFVNLKGLGSLSEEALWKSMQKLYFDRLVVLTDMLKLEQKSQPPLKVVSNLSRFLQLFGGGKKASIVAKAESAVLPPTIRVSI